MRVLVAALLAAFCIPVQAQVSSTTADGRCRFSVATWSISSDSMLPTYATADIVWGVCLHGAVVDAQPEGDLRLSGSQRTVQRGDAVIVRFPGHAPTTVLRRVIGFPGDRVALIHGTVMLNGKALERTSLPLWHGTNGGEVTDLQQAREIAPGGKAYPIVIDPTVQDGTTLEMPERVVAPKHLFLLGDNRSNALDSRQLSFGDEAFADTIAVVPEHDPALSTLLDQLRSTIAGPRVERDL